MVTPAAAERPFTARFVGNHAGNLTTAGNTLMTCPVAAPACAGAQAGGNVNNNAFTMERVDVDGDATTFTSSRADLALPAGATVLFAGLYYGARTSAGTGGVAAPAAASRGTVKLQVPGAAGYETLAAAVDDSTAIAASYVGFVDVTARVASAGSGTYTVADVQSGTGADRYAGWALVVAYAHPSEPARNLSVFDGLQTIGPGDAPVSISVSGFRTPPTGPVRTRVGFVAYEGDRGATGDAAALNGQTLFDASNPANNFFNSSISQFGAPFEAKAPNYTNQLGFDTDLFGADGLLPNNASSATMTISTAQFFADQYLAQVLAFATELFAPQVQAAKAVTNVTRPGQPARPGDVPTRRRSATPVATPRKGW